MSKELNCMNCCIADFKHSLCKCDTGFWKEFKNIGNEKDFTNAVMQRIRPQGEWIEVDDDLISCRCSVCGWEAHLYEDDVYGMPYCPNCGARMKGASDGWNNWHKRDA